MAPAVVKLGCVLAVNTRVPPLQSKSLLCTAMLQVVHIARGGFTLANGRAEGRSR